MIRLLPEHHWLPVVLGSQKHLEVLRRRQDRCYLQYPRLLLVLAVQWLRVVQDHLWFQLVPVSLTPLWPPQAQQHRVHR